MKLYIFRTDITSRKVPVVAPVLDSHPFITRWTIDTEDIDKVLKVETKGNLSENNMINLLKSSGFDCEVLPD